MVAVKREEPGRMREAEVEIRSAWRGSSEGGEVLLGSVSVGSYKAAISHGCLVRVEEWWVERKEKVEERSGRSWGVLGI